MAEKTSVQKDIDSETSPSIPFPCTDIGLEVEDQILYVSKSTLMEKSPVFKKMFESDFLEKNKKVIKLPEKSVEDVTLFLKCLCPFIDHPITVDNVIQIVPLASEYDTQEVIAKCEEVIRDHCNKYSESLQSKKRDDAVMDIRRILDYLIACDKYNLDESVLQAVANVASYIECASLKAHEDCQSLSDKLKLMITMKRLSKFEETYKNSSKCEQRSTKMALQFLFQVRS